MSKPIFLSPEMDAKEINKAIIAAWEKDKKKASEAGTPFDEPQPSFKPNQSVDSALIGYATSGRLQEIPDQAKSSLSEKEAKRLGAALLQYEKANSGPGREHPEFLIKEKDEKGGERAYHLEAKELSGYLQARAKESNLTVAQWVSDKNISLTSDKNTGLPGSGEDKIVGDYTVQIETREGQSRMVGNGDVSHPLKGGAYGDIKGVTVGDGDELDVYVSRSTLEGKDYKIFVFQQMDGDKKDEMKVAFANNADEFRDMMKSTWRKEDEKIFHDKLEGKKPQYVELSKEQFTQMVSEIKGDKEKGKAANPNLTVDEFIQKAGLKEKDIERLPKALSAAEPPQEKIKTASLEPGPDQTERKLHELPKDQLSSVLGKALAVVGDGIKHIAMAQGGHEKIQAPQTRNSEVLATIIRNDNTRHV